MAVPKPGQTRLVEAGRLPVGATVVEHDYWNIVYLGKVMGVCTCPHNPERIDIALFNGGSNGVACIRNYETVRIFA